MDFQTKFTAYKQHVVDCLTSQEINKPDFYAIAVFKALAELTRSGLVTQHASGAEVVERKTLQQHIQTTFPAKDNSRRQEVNKYLSHRYSLARALEPDFIEFVFDGDSLVYTRDDEVAAGSKKTGYRIAEFPQKDALIDYLIALDLKPAYERLTGDSLLDLFNGYVHERSYPSSAWYRGYRETFNQIHADPDFSDETLALIWYERDNSVSSLRQGMPSHKEYEMAKPVLREISFLIKQNATSKTYLQARQMMQNAKSEGALNKMYWALLNRVFAAISPTVCTTTVDENCFRVVASYLDKRFSLGLSLEGNWFEMNEEFKRAISTHLPEDYDPMFANMATWQIYEDIRDGRLDQVREDTQSGYEVHPMGNTNDRVTPLNQILYGPPGTGKTYLLQKKFEQYTSQPEVLEHDVWLKTKLESLNWMQVLTLCLLDIGGKAKVKQLVEHEYFQCKAALNHRDKNLANTAWAALQSFTILDSKTVEYQSHSEPAIFDKTEDAFWFIVKEKLELVEDLVALANEIKEGPQSAEVIQRYSTTTFHQSYGYEEFIEGLRAQTDDDGNIHYSVESGAFLQLCQRAANDPDHRYAMFIDEINRGNISKIFGELITLIEADKRAGCKHAISVKLAYSQEPFSVPANVDIIGTMNTADRSLAMMDTALRRRFDFVEMMPNPALLSGSLVNGIDLERLLKTLNERIEILYDREHTLGHAFLMPVRNLNDEGKEEEAFAKLVSVFQNKVVPLLQEYFFEDWQKIRLVLGDNQREAQLQFIDETTLDDGKLTALFGSANELNHYGDAPKKYQLKPFTDKVWTLEETYIGIYQTNQAKRELE